jgi:hypothetical protein
MTRYEEFLSPLDTVEAAFAGLTTGPSPLSVDGRRIGGGLPQRLIPLDDLKRLLLRRSTRHATKDAAWAELVRRSRCRGPAWVVGAAGVALPGLRRAAGQLAHGYQGDTADLDAEVLTGFLAALRRIDVTRPAICARLRWAAYRAGAALRYADAAAADRQAMPVASTAPPRPWGHPDFVLADAVAKKIITVAEADLIARTRLEDIELHTIAREIEVSYDAAKRRRRRAETRLAAAIRQGDVESRLSPAAG